MSIVFSGALLLAKIQERNARIEEVAVVTGLSFRYLDRLSRGLARPSTRTIEVLAEALGCEPGDLFADDGKSRALPPPDGQPPPPLSAETREKLRVLLATGRADGAA